MNKFPPGPFVLIVDKFATAVDVLPHDSKNDYVYDIVQTLNRNFPKNSPHASWYWNGMQFLQVVDYDKYELMNSLVYSSTIH